VPLRWRRRTLDTGCIVKSKKHQQSVHAVNMLENIDWSIRVKNAQRADGGMRNEVRYLQTENKTGGIFPGWGRTKNKTTSLFVPAK
jgi:hypothetical protein